MPRVHQGIIRRHHGAAIAASDRGRGGGGGIFKLSTPFKDAVAASASASASATASAAGRGNNMFLLASVASDHADRGHGHVNDCDDDSNAAIDAIDDDSDAAKSADDGPAGGGRRRFGDGMEDGDDDDDDSEATFLGEDGIDRDGGGDVEDDDGDDDDDDDDGSVDLLLADEGGAGAFDRRGGGGGGVDGDNHNPRVRRRAREASTAAAASPATRTLDRLATLGSQAELCIHLLVDDAAAGVTDAAAAAATTAAAASPGGGVNEVGGGNHYGKNEVDGHDAGEVAKAAAMADEAVRCNNTERGGGTTAGAATNNTTAPTEAPIRKDDGDGDDDDMMGIRQRCLHSLKKYFMSTKNSSKYAMHLQRQQAKRNHGSGAGILLPTDLAVPFCRRCSRPSSASSRSTSTAAAAMPSHVPPHHGLCPHHDDFYGSGSYEILNLIVDGNLLKCEACVYQFDHGRLNKALCHIDGCERKKRVGNNEKNGGGGGGRANKTSGDSGSNFGGDCADGKESYGKDNTKERGSSDGDEIGKNHFGGGIGTGNLPTISSPAAAGTSTGAGVRSTRSANSQLSPPPGAAMHGQTQTKADAVSKSSFDQGSQSVVQEQGPMFEVGTIVFVQDRTWPGRNDLGGVARIAKVHQPNDEDEVDEDDRATYDVKYVLETRREKYVEERYLSLHTEYVSPSKNAQDSGVVQSENNDSGSQTSAEANEDDTSAIDTVEAKSDGIGDDSNRGTSSPDHVDADGRCLSEYERLRLRNIQRNKSRLAQLGLLVPPDKTDNDASSGTGGKKRKASHQPRGVEVERRFQPKRQTSTNRREGDGKLKVSTSSSAATAADAGDETDKGSKVSRTYAGDSERDDLDQRQSQLKIIMEVEDDHVKQNKQAQNFHVAGNTVVAKLPTATLADAAKAGCRKCTLEWQTEKTYSTMDHDVCCPRVGKRAPPSNNEYLANLSQLIPQCHIEQNKRAHNQPTPSPVPPQRKKNITLQQRPPPHHTPLPAWINKFILEANRHNETVPAPRGSKWIPCPNPWGTIGHEDGDFVIISPFQSETAHDILSMYHQGPNGSGMPKRFVANPLEEGSPYHATHRSPARGGYSALRLLRDMTSSRPWGFTIRLHEFGGACLVESIEPLSPAEAAVSQS